MVDLKPKFIAWRCEPQRLLYPTTIGTAALLGLLAETHFSRHRARRKRNRNRHQELQDRVASTSLRPTVAETCHQLGNAYTRTMPAMFKDMDPAQAWTRRVQSGQAGTLMVNALTRLGPKASEMFGDWTTRIKNGELPTGSASAATMGIEQQRGDYPVGLGGPAKAYLHDEISTDKRDPNVNANGLIYGSAEESRDYLPVLDPVHNTISQVKTPYRDPDTPGQPAPMQPSPIWGDEPIWEIAVCVTIHNPMFDGHGRLWYTSRIRAANDPAFCKAGSSQTSAKLTPVDRSGRQLAVYDPKTKQIAMIDTCFGTHHLMFAADANNTLWTSSGGGGGVVGWLDSKMWDKTHDAEKSQGWTALVLDTNGNGKRDAYVEGEQKVATAANGESLGTAQAVNTVTDPTKDTRLNAAFYGIGISPDGMVWGTVLGFPGGIVLAESWVEPAGNRARGILRSAVATIREEPCRAIRRVVVDVDLQRRRRLGGAGQRTPRQRFDRRNVQRSAFNGPAATGRTVPPKAGRCIQRRDRQFKET